jgi:hypothetical protein
MACYNLFAFTAPRNASSDFLYGVHSCRASLTFFGRQIL